MDPSFVSQECIYLIDSQRIDQAIDYIECHCRIYEDPNIYNIAANVYSWLSQLYNKKSYIDRGLYWSAMSAEIFDLYIENLTKNLEQRKFVLPITQPKSGGSFIFDFLHNNVGYMGDILYTYGSSSNPYLCEYKTQTCYKHGHILSHNHMVFNKHNIYIIEKLHLPIWVHVRDPRDAFYSFINMYTLESIDFRISLYKECPEEYYTPNYDPSIIDPNYILTYFLYVYEFYCNWCYEWLTWNYNNKIITYHQDLADDETAFLNKLHFDILGNTDPIDSIPIKDFKKNRFFYGKNGLWKLKLNNSSKLLLNKIFKKTNIYNYF